MKTVIQKILGNLIRAGLLIVIGWSGAEGVLSESEVAAFISAVTVIVWGIWEKLDAQRKLRAAKDLPAGVSDGQVKALAKTLPYLPKGE